jgi:hypothetical protein
MLMDPSLAPTTQPTPHARLPAHLGKLGQP